MGLSSISSTIIDYGAMSPVKPEICCIARSIRHLYDVYYDAYDVNLWGKESSTEARLTQAEEISL